MSTSSAPAFENKSTCSKCNTSFNLFTRKHHCRQCGRTFCDRCSSWNIPLPHFGFSEPVRVDEKCYQAIQQQQQQQQQQRKPKANSTKTENETETETSTSASPSKSASTPAPAPAPAPVPVRVRSCTCNMPLCICPPDEPTSADEKQNASSSSSQSLKQSQSQYATKDKPVSRPAAATKTPTTTSSFSGFGGFSSLSLSSRSSSSNPASTSTNTNTNTNTISYDLHGDLNEQCREAIKQGDTKGTEYLLKHGAKPNYIDRTGNTLLHLACMFDRWHTVSMFLSAGGDVTHRNPSGETPLDLAPPALQHKISAYFATQHASTTTRPNPDKQ